MKFPALLRTLAVTSLAVVPLLAGPAGPASAEPMSVPFAVAPGDSQSFFVRYLRATSIGQSAEPVLSVDYELEFAVTAVDDDGISATVRNFGANVALDRQRVLTPPDIDSLLLQAVDGLTADIHINPDGSLDRVTNWDALRGDMIDRAKKLAAGNEDMIKAVDLILPNVNAIDAVQLVARPLAMSAPGRIVTFDPPERTSVNVARIELPSFATYAAGAWSFDLVQRNDIPDNTTVEWLGVPSAAELQAILAPFAPRDGDGEGAAPDGRMWQRFSASYDEASGELLFFQGVMELQAGPLRRRTALEAQAKGR